MGGGIGARGRYKAAFSVFDQDGDGTINVDELGTVMKALGKETSEEELTEMMLQADANGDGDVDFSEFLSLMTQVRLLWSSSVVFSTRA